MHKVWEEQTASQGQRRVLRAMPKTCKSWRGHVFFLRKGKAVCKKGRQALLPLQLEPACWEEIEEVH
jgi:hypothetical protein